MYNTLDAIFTFFFKAGLISVLIAAIIFVLALFMEKPKEVVGFPTMKISYDWISTPCQESDMIRDAVNLATASNASVTVNIGRVSMRVDPGAGQKEAWEFYLNIRSKIDQKDRDFKPDQM